MRCGAALAGRPRGHGARCSTEPQGEAFDAARAQLAQLRAGVASEVAARCQRRFRDEPELRGAMDQSRALQYLRVLCPCPVRGCALWRLGGGRGRVGGQLVDVGVRV